MRKLREDIRRLEMENEGLSTERCNVLKVRNGLLHIKAIHPLSKIFKKCTPGGVWIFKYTHLVCMCGFKISFISEGVNEWEYVGKGSLQPFQRGCKLPYSMYFHTGYDMFSLWFTELWVTVHWITVKTCLISYENIHAVTGGCPYKKFSFTLQTGITLEIGTAIRGELAGNLNKQRDNLTISAYLFVLNCDGPPHSPVLYVTVL